MRKLIVLDRDGVINEDSDTYVKSLAEWIPIPGSIEAIGRLSRHGWIVTVATNQSGLARGYFDQSALQQMHDALQAQVAEQGGKVDLIRFCSHGPDDRCNCRKPRSGLFVQIAEHFNIELAGVPVVGDSLRDLEAGIAVGCKPYLVRTGKGQKTALQPLPAGTQVFDNLAAVADYLLDN
ncbi:MAG: D-glycero-D-manno-heptose 1,7-bisphosphate phosphatase [Halopseudomonas sp.]|jgi:D-glycero-D-manno-heptose 1,7-bisphosphate phosphatase|uniref:D-glycero-beta-D-manno-heptose 1,7-bisphosphate 7-phosphatase n=1 Tax=Halopseudomonas sp. TaxID=2901191 RepID=UPI0039E25A3A